jgi:NTE family protein
MSDQASPPNWPVRWIPGDDPSQPPEDGVALCLSGGGYRAMLFHVGAIWRLNELGFLNPAKLKRVSSVSGGSITSGVLALHWSALGLDTAAVAPLERFRELFVEPIRKQARRTIDIPAAALGLTDLGIEGSHLAGFYRHLYGKTKLAQLSDNGPLFIFNSTNLQTGALMRFSKPYLADWRIGKMSNPDVLLAEAVAASSSWPPALSPTKMSVDAKRWDASTAGELLIDPYDSDLVLTDGGVYDNFGLETAFKRYRTVLVSDAGGIPAQEPHPHTDWALQTYRVLMLLMHQIASLRKRQLIGAFVAQARDGTYWSMGSHASDYPAEQILDCPENRTMELARTGTRLSHVDDARQERIINWGYAICDLAMRAHLVSEAPRPTFPYSRGVE